jgi:hypothetical protein
MLTKFTNSETLNNDGTYDYGSVYMLESTPAYTRLKIGASTHGIDLLLHLSDVLDAPFFCLYVLVLNRSKTAGGRYQSPWIESKAELADFLLDYKEVFETDGRHHLWVSSPDMGATLVYDRHNVLYAYGPIEEIAANLHEMGYHAENFELPFPHAHYFHAENDSKVEELLQYWNWQHFPLQEADQE